MESSEDPTLAPRAETDSSGSADDRQSLPAAGTRVGNYEIVGELARGAMGVVFRAYDRALDRQVAVKMILDDDAADDDLRQRFLNEARAAGGLDHPGIVPVFDVGRWRRRPYFAMALVDGQSLADRLQHGPLPTSDAAQIGKTIAMAIDHAHQNQIIHRDLKPANILVDRAGMARVTDFGVSKFVGVGCNLTSQGELIGTPHYMPPEQAGGAHDKIGPTADVYSIGAVLFAMLTGRPPFQAASPLEVVSQVLTQEPVPPSALNASVPVELEVITLKCLQKDSQYRYQSAKLLAEDLGRFLRDEPIIARPPGLLQRSKLWFRKHVMLASLSGSLAILLVVVLCIVAALLIQNRSRVATLESKLSETSELLKSERRALARFLQRNPTTSEDDLISFRIQRLGAAAKSQRDSNPDLALQLALASVELANNRSHEISADLLALIVELANRGIENPDDAGQRQDWSDPSRVIEWAQQHVAKPLSVSDRQLYGIDPPQPGGSAD